MTSEPAPRGICLAASVPTSAFQYSIGTHRLHAFRCPEKARRAKSFKHRKRMTRNSQVMLAVVIAGLTLLVAAKLRYRGSPSLKLPDENCDAEVWKHVYEKDRLRVLQVCTAVDGRVASVHRNS